jgi:hypothetical protein
MKKIYYLTLIGLIFSTTLFAQNQRNRGCTNPLSDYAFGQKFSTIQYQANEASKLKAAIDMVRVNCVTSNQVARIAAAFASDQSRIAFVKEAYIKTYNRGRFHQVYATFRRFKNVAKAHEYIMTWRRTNGIGINSDTSDDNGNTGYQSSISFPNWNYPNVAGYTGAKKGDIYPSYTQFMKYAEEIHQKSNQINKYSKAWQIVTNHTFTTAQVMKLTSLIQKDDYRLALLKGAFNRIYDVDNYPAARVVLGTFKYQQEFDRFLAATPKKLPAPAEVSCLVDGNDFNTMNAQIKKEWVGRKKFSLIQSIFKTKGKCYSINQLKNIAKQFSFASDKMKYVKWAYSYAHKKQDYYQMADAFSSPFDKRKFTAWLKGQK